MKVSVAAKNNLKESSYTQIITELCYLNNRKAKKKLIENMFLTFVFLCFSLVRLNKQNIDQTPQQNHEGAVIRDLAETVCENYLNHQDKLCCLCSRLAARVIKTYFY